MCCYWWLCRQHMDRMTPFPCSPWQSPCSHVFPTCSKTLMNTCLFWKKLGEINIHRIQWILQISLHRNTGICREKPSRMHEEKTIIWLCIRISFHIRSWHGSFSESNLILSSLNASHIQLLQNRCVYNGLPNEKSIKILKRQFQAVRGSKLLVKGNWAVTGSN